MITKRTGSFEKTIRSIKKAVSLGLSIRVCIVEMEETKNDSEKTKAFLRQLGVKNISVDRLRGVRRANRNESSIDPLQELCGACWK